MIPQKDVLFTAGETAIHCYCFTVKSTDASTFHSINSLEFQMKRFSWVSQGKPSWAQFNLLSKVAQANFNLAWNSLAFRGKNTACARITVRRIFLEYYVQRWEPFLRERRQNVPHPYSGSLKQSHDRAADLLRRLKTWHLYFRNHKQYFSWLLQMGLPLTSAKAK